MPQRFIFEMAACIETTSTVLQPVTRLRMTGFASHKGVGCTGPSYDKLIKFTLRQLWKICHWTCCRIAIVQRLSRRRQIKLIGLI